MTMRTPAPSCLRLTDGNGVVYTTSQQDQRYELLPTPVTVTNYCSSSTQIRATGVTIQPAAHPLTLGPATAAFDNAQTEVSPAAGIGGDLPGVKVTLFANAVFARNYANGFGCITAKVIGGNGQEFALDPSNAVAAVNTVLPITMKVSRSCIAPHVATPESQNDVEIRLSGIAISN